MRSTRPTGRGRARQRDSGRSVRQWEVTRRSTAPTTAEIWKDTDGGVDIVQPASERAGPSPGVGRGLQGAQARGQIIAVEPESPILNGGGAAAQDPGHRRQLRPGSSTPRSMSEVIGINADTAVRWARRAAAGRRACSSVSRRARRCHHQPWIATRPERQRDGRRHHPELRRSATCPPSSSRPPRLIRRMPRTAMRPNPDPLEVGSGW